MEQTPTVARIDQVAVCRPLKWHQRLRMWLARQLRLPTTIEAWVEVDGGGWHHYAVDTTWQATGLFIDGKPIIQVAV